MDRKEVQMRVGSLFYVQSSMTALLNICEVNGPRCITLTIGRFEADAICQIRDDIAIPRPMTHDLLKDILEVLHGRLYKVLITDVQDRIFQAEMFIRTLDEMVSVQARPSDAIAMALRCVAPIYIVEDLLEQLWKQQNKTRVLAPEDSLESCLADSGDLSRFDTDFLRSALQRYVSNEEYEKAILLRNELERRQ